MKKLTKIIKDNKLSMIYSLLLMGVISLIPTTTHAKDYTSEVSGLTNDAKDTLRGAARIVFTLGAAIAILIDLAIIKFKNDSGAKKHVGVIILIAIFGYGIIEFFLSKS